MIAENDSSKDGCNSSKVVCRLAIVHPDQETLLKLRVEQQLDVICSLKCEVNGKDKENDTIRSEVEEIEASNSQLQVRLAQEVRAKETMSDRFDTLASNHKEMIELMKEYKQECHHLKQSLSNRGESRDISEEVLKPLRDELQKKTNEIQQLQSSVADINSSLSEETIELKQSIQTITSRESQLVTEMYTVRQDSAARVSLFEEKLEGVNVILELNRRENTDLHDKIKLMQEEKSGVERNCLKLQEELTSSKIEVERLEVEVRESNERRQASEIKFKTEADKISKDIHTSQLRKELEEVRQKLSSLVSRHQSYKEYTRDLLEQEKEMNKKLRDVLS